MVVITGVARSLDFIGDTVFGLQQQHERMDRIAISQMLRGVLQILVVAAAAYITRNVLWAVTGQAVVSLVVLSLMTSGMRGGCINFPGQLEIRLGIPHWFVLPRCGSALGATSGHS